MNRPLVIMAIGAVVVLVAIAANFLLWRQEVAELPVAEQSSEPNEALKEAVEAAARAAEKAERAADRALAAREAAEKAAAEARAPGATDNSVKEAAEAEQKASEAEFEARRAAAAAEAARALAQATSQTSESAAPEQTFEVAARAAEQAERAVDRALIAREAAERALAAASAPGATEEAAREAAEAERQALEAETEARHATAAAEVARAVAAAASAPPDGSALDRPADMPDAVLPSARQGPAPDTRRGPRFDVVRISPSGDAVMAGRAEPGQQVWILDRGRVIGEVTTDHRGEWVFVPEAPLPPGTSELTLEMPREGGQSVISDSAVVLVVPEPGRDIAGRPAEPNSRPLALMVPRSTPESASVRDRQAPSVVLQGPTEGGVSIPLSIDVIDYDEAGRLSISGRAPRPSVVHLYLDNVFVGRSITNQAGIWLLSPEKQVAPGLYTLRADQVDENGKVEARVSIPFTRAEPLAPGQGRYVIVQPGNSLWRIARQTYGTGFKYTVIYDANTRQIADPDLIFPGQIFALPNVN